MSPDRAVTLTSEPPTRVDAEWTSSTGSSAKVLGLTMTKRFAGTVRCFGPQLCLRRPGLGQTRAFLYLKYVTMCESLQHSKFIPRTLLQDNISSSFAFVCN